jgi:hypothetical protein
MNSVQLNGYVTHKWKYGTDRFLRLAVQRGPALPAKVEDEDRDGQLVRRDCDYISVRLPASLFGGMPVDFAKGTQLEIVGFLQSRDYYESLAGFLNRANGGPPPALPDDYDAGRLQERRSAVEVVAQSVAKVENNGQKVYILAQESLVDNAPVHHP